MSKELIANMRKIIEESSWPLTYDKWPNNLTTNCISYALGLPIDDPEKEIFNDILSDNPIEKLENLFNILGLLHRRIESESEIKENEYGIVLYHYFYKEERNFCGCRWSEDMEEIHLVRIHNGTWTHKFGWYYDTSVTTPKQIHDIIFKNDNVEVIPTAFFAIRKP